MKFQSLFFLIFSMAFGVFGINDLITEGVNYVHGWFSIYLSCGFAVVFIRDSVKNKQIRNTFTFLGNVFFWVAIIFMFITSILGKRY